MRHCSQLAHLSTEWLLVEGFQLATATVAQKAACRIIDGLPLGELAGNPDVQQLVGQQVLDKTTGFGPAGWYGGTGGGLSGTISPPNSQPSQPETFSGRPPSEVLLLGSIRSAKTMISACAAVRASQTVSLGMLKAGEVARFSIISLRMELAQVAFGLVTALLRSRPELSALVVGEPTKDVVEVRHPSGRVVEIACVAATKAGSSGLSRWSMGVIFDEAARMCGSEDGVVNLDHMASGLRGRLLPGAQILYITSPWARQGPVYRMAMQYWNTGETGGPVVLRGPGPLLNPVWWTPERCEELRRKDPDAHRTDVMGQFLEPESSWLEDCLSERQLCLPESWQAADLLVHYGAAIDPATRGNGWTLVVVGRTGDTVDVVGTHEWRGTPEQPLSPRWVFCEIARMLKPYGVSYVMSDPWSQDSMSLYARDSGLNLCTERWTSSRTAEAMNTLRAALMEGEVRLPVRGVLVEDLRNAKKRTTIEGVQLQLPLTPDGRHCDFVPALLRALSVPLPAKRLAPVVRGSMEWQDQQDRLELEWAMERAGLESRATRIGLGGR